MARRRATRSARAEVDCSATDATSGVNADGCKVTVAGGNANGVGGFTYTATATK